MIVGIPPLEVIPTFISQASGDRAKLSLLKSLSAQFNSELQDFESTFTGEAKNGKVFWFDLASLVSLYSRWTHVHRGMEVLIYCNIKWYSFSSYPATYGFSVSPITTTCFNSTTGSVCKNATGYIYFDSLHPVTSTHKIIANKMNAIVASG